MYLRNLSLAQFPKLFIFISPTDREKTAPQIRATSQEIGRPIFKAFLCHRKEGEVTEMAASDSSKLLELTAENLTLRHIHS